MIFSVCLFGLSRVGVFVLLFVVVFCVLLCVILLRCVVALGCVVLLFSVVCYLCWNWSDVSFFGFFLTPPSVYRPLLVAGCTCSAVPRPTIRENLDLVVARP
jgi:hypothetical protein